MRVVTLHNEALAEAAGRLWAQAALADRPQIVVGIRSGGYVVAQAMMPATGEPKPLLLPITRRRASSDAKTSNPLVGRILRALPYAITDLLRLAEHRMLTRKRTREVGEAMPKIWEPDPVEAAALEAALAANPNASVLVVDDAIDTGSTLKAVNAFIARCAPQARLRSAVIVRTTDNPVVQPDITLYTHVLCRFPWSHDFSG